MSLQLSFIVLVKALHEPEPIREETDDMGIAPEIASTLQICWVLSVLPVSCVEEAGDVADILERFDHRGDHIGKEKVAETDLSKGAD
jgi:hypothetical protein